MFEARRTIRSEELLFERERQGVRTLTIVRGLFVVVAVAMVWIIGINLFEKIATTAVAMLALVSIGGALFLLARSTAVATVGLAGCMIDIAILGALPVIWYNSVGGSDVPPAFMLKTQITVVTLGIIALNALAIRPLYPIVVAAGGLCVHVVLLVYALHEPRTIISSNFADSAMGPALSLELVLVSMLIIAFVGAAMGYLALIARRTIVEGVRLEVTNAQFGRYFSPGVVSRISREADALRGVGGRTQDVAVMFCDIRDFTTITEQLPPSDVVRFLSQYHTHMVEVIFKFGGTIDKFIGDAIMVTFGTPDPSDDDAERSVRAGLAMNTALAALNADRERRNLPNIRHGIGIHFGPVIAGNIGTEDRLEYTVIGDTVNVASRIQDACKSVGEALLISDAVKKRLAPDFHVQTLPEQRVRGRQAPVRIYAVKEHASSE
ncbi:MAG: adenylate/guanylate cyclase domain-containing protein [Geminicoccaceae bacterium]